MFIGYGYALRKRPLKSALIASQGVFLIADGFMPFRLTSIARDIENDMREPRIAPRAVPVLDVGRDDYDHAGMQRDRLLAPLSVPSLASRAD